MVDDSTVNSLAAGRYVIAVGNLDRQEERVHPTSSQGPTRDGRFKPEVVAPGTNILGANGFDLPEQPWVRMSGTSIASPYIAGLVGLMLSRDPSLTAAQINGILLRGARPLPDSDYRWCNDAGYGVVDPGRCLEEARTLNAPREMEGGAP